MSSDDESEDKEWEELCEQIDAALSHALEEEAAAKTAKSNEPDPETPDAAVVVATIAAQAETVETAHGAAAAAAVESVEEPLHRAVRLAFHLVELGVDLAVLAASPE